MIDFANFWSANYYEHPPLTDGALAQAELVLGVRLPAELVKLLRIQNGGYTRGFFHPMKEPTTWAKDNVPLHDLAGVLVEPHQTSPMNLVRTPELVQEWGLPPNQVLLSGDGHYWITLDYRTGSSPSVAWIDVECGEDKQVAPSFAAFLQGLLPEPEQREA
jgi:hypothetical protein